MVEQVPDPGPADALLDALVTRFTEGYAAAIAPLSRRAVGEFDGGADQRWLWLACRLSQDLWDDELWHVLATRGVRIARDTGALGQLPIMTNFLGVLMVHSGTFATAAALIDEVDALTQATGMPPIKFAAVTLAASRGDQAQTRAITDAGWRMRGRVARARRSASANRYTRSWTTATGATMPRSPKPGMPAPTRTCSRSARPSSS